MLEVLKRLSITNVAVVVTRYFGGDKLGAGEAVRAYSHTPLRKPYVLRLRTTYNTNSATSKD